MYLALNDKKYEVNEGEYSGYKVAFNLEFVDGGYPNTIEEKMESSTLDDYPIGNYWEKGSAKTDKRFVVKDGKTTGGYVIDHKFLRMNSTFDFTRERIHEIFHTLYFDNDGAEKGIGNYVPGTDLPNQDDVNALINNPDLPKISNTTKNQ